MHAPLRPLTAALLGAALLAGPAAAASPAPDAAPGLVGTDWQLTMVAGSGVPEIPVPEGILAWLATDGTTAWGSGGCNSWNGSVTIDGDTIDFGDAAMTMMACPDDVMAFESTFLAHLALVDGWRITDGALELLAGGAPLLRFAPRVPVPLAGTTWQATGILIEDGIVSTAPEVMPTLTIDGTRAAGSTGCNRWFADVSVDGSTIAFGPAGGTEMWCEGVMETEAAWYAALAGAASWAEQWGSLTLFDAAGNVLATFVVGAAPAASPAA